LRRLIIALPIVLACLGLAVMLGPLVLPKATTGRIAAALIEQVLDRPVAVTGDAELTLFPTFRIAAQGVSAQAVARGGRNTPALFDVGTVIVEIDVTALLYNRVRIENPVLRFQVDGDGTANWRRSNGIEKPRPPADDSWSANSTNNRSTTVALTVPSDDIAWDSSRISSSSIFSNNCAECWLPTASMKIAAFCIPVSER
jgi:uncharacterized protein involved in outer membrane biogenesis